MGYSIIKEKTDTEEQAMADRITVDGTVYKLTFEDNFEGSTLDTTKWELCPEQPRQFSFFVIEGLAFNFIGKERIREQTSSEHKHLYIRKFRTYSIKILNGKDISIVNKRSIYFRNEFSESVNISITSIKLLADSRMYNDFAKWISIESIYKLINLSILIITKATFKTEFYIYIVKYFIE